MSTPSARASGEFAFEQLFDAFKDERDYLGTKNFWFKSGSNGDREILKNHFLPLMTVPEMKQLPFPQYGAPECSAQSGHSWAAEPVEDAQCDDYSCSSPARARAA